MISAVRIIQTADASHIIMIVRDSDTVIAACVHADAQSHRVGAH